MRTPRHIRSAVACSALLLFAIAGCGGGGGGTTSGGPRQTSGNPLPTITSISPTFQDAGGPDFTLTVNGSNFISSSRVRWIGLVRPTVFVSASRLTATISSGDISSVGSAPVTVLNPAPGGGTSNAVFFTISGSNPVPSISGLSPSTALPGSPDFQLTVNGSGFGGSSVVQWQGSPRSTTFVGTSTLRAAISAADIAVAGTFQVTVVNPAPGGGTSAPASFVVGAAPLTITTTQLPATAPAKAYDLTLGSSGGLPPISWTLEAGGALPDGLAFSADGRISGVVQPVASDTTFNFTARATDSSGTPQTDTQPLSILVRQAGLSSNNGCPAGATPISNGALRASISPYGDVDVYSFTGTAGSVVSIEAFAERLELDGDPGTVDSYLDTVMELLNGSCTRLIFNDDQAGLTLDSRITFTLPSTGTYFIRLRDWRGDGRPDLIYDLRLEGAN